MGGYSFIEQLLRSAPVLFCDPILCRSDDGVFDDNFSLRTRSST
jgi:hypothetical protein